MSAGRSGNPVAWFELILECDRGAAARLSDLLSEAGAVSVSLSNARDEALIERDRGDVHLWPATCIRGLFDTEADAAHLVRVLQEAGFGAPHIRPVEDRDWSLAWREHFHPQRFGERLWVLPSFAEAPVGDGVCVRLDPGRAFGTGNHATTALCLEWLAGLPLKGKHVIDYGCGSGILAIAAVALGADSARCVDNDPEALAAAAENARSNGVEERLGFCLPDDLPRRPADVLVANILSEPLIGLAGSLAKLLKRGGRIALSGILSDQAEAVTAAYKGYIAFDAPARREGWVRLSGTRLAAAAVDD